MTDEINKPDTDPVNLDGWFSAGYKNVQLNYFLYLLSYVFGVTSIVGLVFGYINRDEADNIAYSHYQYQIRTFWIGLLYGVISTLLMIIAVGVLLFLLVAVWWLVRSIKGLMLISRKEPIPNPDTWLF